MDFISEFGIYVAITMFMVAAAFWIGCRVGETLPRRRDDRLSDATFQLHQFSPHECDCYSGADSLTAKIALLLDDEDDEPLSLREPLR